MENPLFSIIMPVYNAASTLSYAIESVLKQHNTNYEFLIVDDGSSDSSPDILRKYMTIWGGKIRVLQQENCGVSAARNKGIDNAKGRFILFLDADDTLCSTALTDIEKAIDTAKEVKIVTYDCTVKKPDLNIDWINKACLMNEKFKEIDKDIFLITNDMSESYLQALSTYVVWNKAYDREFIEQYAIRFKKGIYSGEDFCFNLVAWMCSNGGNVVYIRKPLYNYIQNPNSCIHQNANRTIEAVIENQKILYKTVLEEIDNRKLPYYCKIPLANSCIHSIYAICEALFYNKMYAGWSFLKKMKKLESILDSNI